MAINARAVVRVIIEGEWIWVERGTFTVIDFEFEDDDGKVLSSSGEPAYFFMSTNGAPYFGPLTSLSLIKLDNQILEESGGDVAEKVKMRAIGPGATDEPDEEPAEEEADDAEPEDDGESSREAIPLFAGDEPTESVDDDQETDEPTRTGLF